MSEKSFTFFEIHLHDGLSFEATNTAPAIGGSTDDEGSASSDSDANEDATDESSGMCPTSGGRLLGALVAVGFLVALAAAAKYLRGDDEVTEIDDFVEE
ncbi:hypothetical protein [Halobellus inordinatus]|uniref:hypothetical protein n=1 Tax=Halobellus inordinatus TaxID=1126236 RepID=UPI00211487C9|nr:hypothetical protein [Halobellus ramosii]